MPAEVVGAMAVDVSNRAPVTRRPGQGRGTSPAAAAAAPAKGTTGRPTPTEGSTR